MLANARIRHFPSSIQPGKGHYRPQRPWPQCEDERPPFDESVTRLMTSGCYQRRSWNGCPRRACPETSMMRGALPRRTNLTNRCARRSRHHEGVDSPSGRLKTLRAGISGQARCSKTRCPATIRRAFVWHAGRLSCYFRQCKAMKIIINQVFPPGWGRKPCHPAGNPDTRDRLSDNGYITGQRQLKTSC